MKYNSIILFVYNRRLDIGIYLKALNLYDIKLHEGIFLLFNHIYDVKLYSNALHKYINKREHFITYGIKIL